MCQLHFNSANFRNWPFKMFCLIISFLANGPAKIYLSSLHIRQICLRIRTQLYKLLSHSGLLPNIFENKFASRLFDKFCIFSRFYWVGWHSFFPILVFSHFLQSIQLSHCSSTLGWNVNVCFDSLNYSFHSTHEKTKTKVIEEI